MALADQTQSISPVAIGLFALILVVSIGHVFLLQGAEPYILGLPWWAVATTATYFVLTGAVIVFINLLGGE
jgi:hypothetical protein